MAGSDLIKRIVTMCGACLMRETEDTYKSPKTAHRIVGRYKCEELKQTVQIIVCTRCGNQSEWVPRSKMPKADMLRLNAEYIRSDGAKRDKAKLAKMRRLAREKIEARKQKEKQSKRRTR